MPEIGMSRQILALVPPSQSLRTKMVGLVGLVGLRPMSDLSVCPTRSTLYEGKTCRRRLSTRMIVYRDVTFRSFTSRVLRLNVDGHSMILVLVSYISEFVFVSAPEEEKVKVYFMISDYTTIGYTYIENAFDGEDRNI